MATVEIIATLQGETVIARSFDALEERLGDATPAWPAVIAVYKQLTRRAFATEGESTGEAWPALAPRTQRERARLGYGAAHPILERSQRLLHAVTLESGENTVVDAPKYLGIAIEVEYFVYHQSNQPRMRLPRRAPINFTADDRHVLVRPLRLYFTGYDPAGGGAAA